MFRNLKIRTKILTGFLVMILLILAVGYVGFIGRGTMGIGTVIEKTKQPTEQIAQDLKAEESPALFDVEIAPGASVSLTWRTLLILSLVIIIAFIAATALGLYIARSISRPIGNLSQTAQAIASGDLTKRAEVKSKDEIGKLAISFNQMTESLIEMRKFPENIIRSMGDSLIVATLEAKIKEVNQATLNLLGYQRKELIGQPIEQIFGRAAEEETIFRGAGLEKLIKDGFVKDKEMTYQTKKGKGIPVVISGSVMRDEENKLISIVVIAKDMREVQRLQREKLEIVESEQQKMQSLLNTLTNGVALFNQEKKITFINPAMMRLTGLPQEGFYLSELTRLFKKDQINIEEKLEEAFARGEMTHIEGVPLLNFFYEIFITPVMGTKGKIVGGMVVLYDITHVKEIERMKTEFVSIASHQLRTPLTAIKLFIEMLVNEEAGKLNTQQKDYMDNVGQSTERMIRLVNDLLNVSRLETGKLKIEPKLTQLETFIQNIIDEVDPVTKDKKCRLVFSHSKENLPKIPIDPTLMRQVIHNLVMNAIDYSPAKQCDILVELAQKDHNYVVSVKDNGIGIPKDVQARIFEKFFRADNARKIRAEGSGLGMYVAKMIMEASGGKIWFESPPKGEKTGTTFYISLSIKGMKKKEGEKGLANNKS